MPEYVLNRTYLLRTPEGVVSFEKGQPTWVTPVMEKAATGIGAERVDGEHVDMLDPEPAPEKVLTTDEREGNVYAAFDLLVDNNDAKDFTGQGVPRVRSVERLTNMNFEQAEVIELWHKYRAAKLGE